MSIDSLGVSDVSNTEGKEPGTPLEECLVMIQELQDIQRIQANLLNKLKLTLIQKK